MLLFSCFLKNLSGYRSSSENESLAFSTRCSVSRRPEGRLCWFRVLHRWQHAVSPSRYIVSLTALCQALMAFMYPNKNVNTQSFGNDDLGIAQSWDVSLRQLAQPNIKFISWAWNTIYLSWQLMFWQCVCDKL